MSNPWGPIRVGGMGDIYGTACSFNFHIINESTKPHAENILWDKYCWAYTKNLRCMAPLFKGQTSSIVGVHYLENCSIGRHWLFAATELSQFLISVRLSLVSVKG